MSLQQQVELIDPDGWTAFYWIDISHNLKEGQKIKLKGSATKWTVKKVYLITVDSQPLHSDWKV